VAAQSGVTAIAAGRFHTVALKSNGTVVAWGAGTANTDRIPEDWGQSFVPVAARSGVTAIAAGEYHTVALKSAKLALVKIESPSGPVDAGQSVRLSPQTVNAKSFQWYRNGEPLPGGTTAVFAIGSAQFSDSGTYQLLAQNDADALLTPPTMVRVIPVGYPRVVVNGNEVQTSTRQGDSAEVRLSTTLPNGQLFYTLDGSEPSLESTRYAGPFTVTHTVAVRALALSGDFTQEATSDAVGIQIVPTYALTTAVTGSGKVERSPVLARYLEDDVVTVKAVADGGWRFVRWEEDLMGAFPERNVAMSRNKTVRAVFEAIPAHEIILRFAGYHVNPNLDALRPGEVVRTIVGGISEGRPVRIVYHGRDVADGPATQRMRWAETVTDLSGGSRLFESPTTWNSSQTGLLNEGTPVSRLDGDRFFVTGPEIPWELAVNGILSGTYSLGRLSFIYAFECDGQPGQGEKIPPGCQGRWGWKDFNVFTSGSMKPEIHFGSLPASIGLAVGSSPALDGSVIQVVTSPRPGWSFLGWSGDHVGSETNFSWVVDGPATFEANFGTTVSTLATGPGRVVLEPELAVYPYGTQVKVIPVPDAGNYLALWGEAGAGQPKTEWVLMVTNAQPRVTALFRALAADKVAVNVQSTLGGRVTQPAADGLYARNSVVTLTAVPDNGHEFIGWSGDASGTVAEITLTLDTSKTVRAEFRRAGVVSHPLTVTVTGPGTVRRVPDQGAYEAGSAVELVAEPAGDAVFAGWSGAITGTQRRVRLTISGNTAVTATFLPVHPVATETRGEGQVLLSPPEGRYAAGTAVALTARPADGWGFVQWNGDLTTTGQEASLTVDAPKRVIAEFARLGTLTTKAQGQGSISRTPDAAAYLPGTVVSLKATPAAGWKFERWSGGATGTAPELTVTVGRTEAIVAEFADAETPAITVDEPVTGTVTDERFTLRGRITDNVGVGHASWQWNGLPQGNLTLNDGQYAVAGLELRPGTNRLTVSAFDPAGNLGQVTRTVVWSPVRTLAVGAAAEVQEGQRLTYSLSLESPGDVAGLRFRLTYNPTYLTDPQIEWGALVGQSVNTLNLTVAGEIEGAFALAGSALPAGSNRVATVSFRARSVAGLTNISLLPVFLNAANAAGEALTNGNGAIPGEGRIKPRRLKGDNNANQRLDIGDAVVISRLQVGLEERRSWDVALNDLNSSGVLDSGDVVKALRAVVGLDPQPTPSGGIARAGLSRQAVNTNEVVVLEFPDGPVAALGQPWRVVVRLAKSRQAPSGLSFTLRYPAGLTLAEKQVGALVPAGALPLWGAVPGGLTFAAVSPDAWPAGTGVAAVLTFTANAGLATQAEWPLTLSPVELTVNGFDIRAPDDVAGVVRSAVAPTEPPAIKLPPPGADGKLALEVTAGAGAEVIVETTTDLNAWSETQQVTGQGTGTPVRVTITPQAGVEARFWRVRRP
jgi:hypothetical protein